MNIWDGNVTLSIDGMMNRLKINESHVSNEVINRYNCFIQTGYDEYTRLDNHIDQMAARMSSHPFIKPSWDAKPDTLVLQTVEGTDSDFLSRASNMASLTLVEQNAQLFYLSKVWECYKIINELLSMHRNHAGLLKERNKLNQTMTKAQELWRNKNKKRTSSTPESPRKLPQ